MKRAYALIAVFALMSMLTASQAVAAEDQGFQGWGPAMLEPAADVQPMIPAQWREDRFATMSTAGAVRQQRQLSAQPMIPAQWREDRLATIDRNEHRIERRRQAAEQGMVPAQWREDRLATMPTMAGAKGSASVNRG